MESSVCLSLLEPDEREQLDYIWTHISDQDRAGMTQDDVLFVLDAMDDYLEQAGLLTVDEKTGEVTYLDGDIDETEQLNYLLARAQEQNRRLSSSQVQIILDGELQYGIEQGYYEEED